MSAVGAWDDSGRQSVTQIYWGNKTNRDNDELLDEINICFNRYFIILQEFILFLQEQ